MRKEKKLNPVKKLAKKTALRTAYQAQAHAKQAGQEIRGGASGEGPSDNYAQQKVEDKAKEAAEDAAGFAFRSTKIPYKMYEGFCLKGRPLKHPPAKHLRRRRSKTPLFQRKHRLHVKRGFAVKQFNSKPSRQKHRKGYRI